MKNYKYLAHTADIRLKVKADTLKELLEVSLEGMNHIIKKDFCNHNSDFHLKEKVEVESIDKTSLLIDFLAEVLTLSQINKAIYCKVKFEQLTKTKLSATIFGNYIDKFDEDIKAVTYHEAEIITNSEKKLETIIIFDI